MRNRVFMVALFVGVVSPCYAQQGPERLSSMSMEDLLNIQVTSVSKTEQKLSQTASAVFVIAQDDIQRSGATNIPGLLRMVPGMDVAQINANNWAISARGFNGRYTDSFQVLLDGRSVYVPSFGGVYWDVFDVPLEDIDRIEVIRGPGGSVWGANAVNGVINIVTKKAGQTKGATLTAGGGNLDQAFGTIQYGGSFGKSNDYRLYSKFFTEDQLPALTGGSGGDGWHLTRGGFRTDSALSAKDQLTVQGNIYSGREDQTALFLTSLTSQAQLVEIGVDLSGGFLQAIWTHQFSERSQSALQVSYNRDRRDNIVQEGSSVLNLDFQYQCRWRERHNLLWGISVNDSRVTTTPSLAVSFTPPDANLLQAAVFAQDEIALLPNRLFLTIGARLEHEYYNGFGVMPTVRAAWLMNRKNTLWAAVSRAIRTPGFNDASLRLNFGAFTGSGGMLFLPAVFGNSNLLNESLIDYELGYRSVLSPRLSLDLSVYYNQYFDQQTAEPAAPFFEADPAPSHIVLPTVYQNLMQGQAYGFESFAGWKVSDRWTLSPGYAFEGIRMHLDPTSRDTTSVAEAEGSAPRNSAQLRSHWSLPHGLAWDTSAYFVGRIADPVVPSYTRLDTGLTWQAGERLSFSIFGQNLLNNERLEYLDTLASTTSTLVKRSAYAKVKWAF